MLINLTDMFIEEAASLDEFDAQLISEALGDIDRVDEVGSLLSPYEASEIIVDVDEDYFVALQEELPNTKLTLGLIYE